MKAVLQFILFLSLTSCYIGEGIPVDQNLWMYDLPSNNGLDQDQLLLINDRLNSDEFESIEGLIILKNNRLVFENYYFNDASRSYVKNLGIAGLSFTLAAVGVADGLGLLSLSDEIVQYLPEYEDLLMTDPNKVLITIEDLLTHRSGIIWNETIQGYFSPSSDLILMKETDNWIEYILNKSSDAAPGLRYSFNTANGLILSKIIENASGMEYDEFLSTNILEPLGIESLTIEQDPRGNYNGGDGYSVSLIDWTKLAYLFLEGGIWQGRTIIDPNFVEESRTIQFPAQANPTSGYNLESIGYLWGLFGDQSEGRFGADHLDIYYAFGQLGQSIFIIPSENMVVSILSDNFFFSSQQSLNLFTEITFSIQ